MATTQSKVTEEGEIIETTAIVKIEPIVKPAVSAEDALSAWKAYQDLKAKILTGDDIQDIQGKQYPKKSAWRKLATFFNLSVDLVKEEEIKNEDGTIDFDITYKAIAPNGRSVVGDGSCNSHEKSRPISRHVTRGTAHTRAFNRAVSNLIGGGEVSAEEMPYDDHSRDDGHGAGNPAARTPAPTSSKREFKTISKPQANRFKAIAGGSGWTNPERDALLKEFGYDVAENIAPKDYDKICSRLQGTPPVVLNQNDNPPPYTDNDIPF